MPYSSQLGNSPRRVAGKGKLVPVRATSKLTMDSLFEEPKGVAPIPKQFVGVKNHLPLFYGKQDYVDPEYLDKELGCSTSTTRSRICNRFFEVLLTIGVIAILTGAVLAILGYSLPRRDVVVEKQASIEVHDKTAIDYNELLELFILLGVIIACIGGSLATVSLTVMSSLPADDPYRDDLDHCNERTALFTDYPAIDDNGPKSPLEEKIPAVEHLKAIQPDWEKKEEKEESRIKNGIAFRF